MPFFEDLAAPFELVELVELFELVEPFEPLEPFSSAARSMISRKSAPVSPPVTGRLDFQMSGLSSARISWKS